jgi:hypothetical protein
MSLGYKIHANITKDYHIPFDKECENIDIENFRKNSLMSSIVQNCSKESGEQQLKYLLEHHKEVMEKVNYTYLYKLDSIGGYNNNGLINGLTPKIFSYIREAIIFIEYYLKPKQISEINKLLIIGGGYGLEGCIIYYICNISNIKINKIIGVDMPNVAKLQNEYFKIVGMDSICKSYSTNDYSENVDIVYSNCCLAELTCDINYLYYNKYCSTSIGFYIIWGLWAADIPDYYIPYIVNGDHNEKINYGLKKNTNATIVK